MATEKENKMYDAAIAKVADLEGKLISANTEKQRDTLEDRLTDALKRLVALETKSKPETKPEEVDEEEEEEDEDQCPVCGHELTSYADGTYHCAGCNEYFEDDEQ